ncbi:NADH:flavin oxidoreductase [Aeoliella sp. ICT_H6.2]|uniref:NADH:flavin oxidoreductase n=1 Tax=Aeoliella straminimaris TaxID=2954799 RepID=A0A9X2JHM5_9BACT|nr:NADH:flavin oxidoreductase [Aeoliella straminimaris]MCO6043064.1 NADH:flavin oxidoreductase [Aeoliella straminimaris]
MSDSTAKSYTRVAKLRTPEDFLAHLASLGVEMPFDAELESGPDSPMGASLEVAGRKIGNRFCILPMEGWDGETNGNPTELTRRRWENFGLSGAKLIWGGEAVAVTHEGRANPNQVWMNDGSAQGISDLRTHLVETHAEHCGSTDDLLVGLQLTHSGRFARPNDKKRLEPKVLYRHPVLDKKFGMEQTLHIMTDDEIEALIDRFVEVGAMAADMGYDFVDLKHCHGYLGHEFLSAFDRPGPFGGSFENRTRFLRELVTRLRAKRPELLLGVRVSAVDWPPFKPGDDGAGVPQFEEDGKYHHAFGGDQTGLDVDLAEPIAFLKLLEELDVPLVCISVGSPYYNPHFQRPALFPPSDGYSPPEDPLVGVARQIAITAKLKEACPNSVVVGSGYTYLQQWLPNVGQAAVRQGKTDFVGLGRMVLSYPEMPADVLAGRPLANKKICRTFSDCTTAPRNGLVSGCYPLDPVYKSMPEYQQLADIKSEIKKG